MHRGYRRLDLIAPDRPVDQHLLDEANAFGDLFPVPQRPVLCGERDEPACGVGAADAAAVVQEHQRE